MTKKYDNQKNKLIIILVITLFVFLSSIAYYIYDSEKSHRYSMENNRLHTEIELLADFISDFIIRSDYAETKNFLKKWVSKKAEVVYIEVKFTNGKVLFLNEKDCDSFVQLNKDFNIDNKNISISLSHDIIDTKLHLNKIAVLLILTVHILTFVIGLTLWFILSRWILKPLNNEIKYQTEEIKKYTKDLEKLNRSHMALSKSNMALLTSKNRQELLDNICSIIHNICKYKLVWIGIALDDEKKSIQVLSKDGVDIEYTNNLDVYWSDCKRGNGPTGRAIREKKAIIINDTQNDISFKPWKENAKKNGFLSCASFPIITNITDNKVFGSINIYSGFTNAFLEEEIELLNELSSNLAYGIIALEDRNQVKHLSITDMLTGLNNRLKIDESLDYEIQRAKRYDTELSIIMLDIDHFKSVNDNFGHQVGDKVLQEFSSILKNVCRDTDVIGRWGGEEFIVICINSNKDNTIELAQRLRKSVEEFSFFKVNHKTTSLGVSTYKDGDNKDIMTKRADDALYDAKHNNRNCVKFI